MIQGTMSSAGKSLLAAGLCRIFKQDGWKVAPFKSQNMALNSFVTADGFEMGRAQVMQAEAAGVEASVLMNPILLKPTSDRKSQVIVNGRVVANMDARDYFEYKKQLVPAVMEAFEQLSSDNDVIVIEGAGSPAEINLRDNDIVNMGLAQMVDAPVLLVGDIDRGGVFAQLLGTLDLLAESERERVKGLVINKFRGDLSLLEPGLRELEARGRVPVTGVVPYMKLSLDDEDSLTERFGESLREKQPSAGAGVKICVIRLPHISNFSDFSVFDQFAGQGLLFSYIDKAPELRALSPDMIIIPGSKNTIGDLRWLKESGIADAVTDFAGRGGVVMGICGGFQMLGQWVSDPAGVEVDKGSREQGLGLLKVTTDLESEKITRQVSLEIEDAGGFFGFLKGKSVSGYEIHAGKTLLESGKVFEGPVETGSSNVLGTYIHGFFDQGDIALSFVRALAERKGIKFGVENGSRTVDFKAFKESQYDLLADTLRKSLDMKSIYKIIGLPEKKEARHGQV
ncbi:cobyric acid synthase [Treponema sp. JC4]|uniref:cobyric acid synthase n=1 Tax=Treponema sp. JC4 TaxID=1124982 RepID=UPI0002DE5E34|nr:cobyric acid synthase [Treponema sp. JC4]